MLLRAWKFIELEEGANHRTSEGDAEQYAARTWPVSHTVASVCPPVVTDPRLDRARHE